MGLRGSTTGGWTREHNEELNDLYSSPNIIRVIKSRRMRWVGREARMAERSGTYRVWCGNLRKRDHLEEIGVDGRIILKWIFKNWDWIDLAQTGTGCYECSDETLGSVKRREFLD